MVNKETVEKIFDEAITKSKIVIVKCKENSTTRRGQGAKVTLTGNEGEPVPTRHLQDKGYDDKGNHLGYIARIDYPDGTNINYVDGTLTIDGKTYQMGFEDNFRTVNGNIQHDPKGSANGLFKQQKKDILNTTNGKKEWKRVRDYGSLMKRSTISRQLDDLIKKGVEINSHDVKGKYNGTPLGKLIQGFTSMDNLASRTNCDYKDIVVGEQVRFVNAGERRTITTSNPNMTSTSVGFLNDKKLNVHNPVTGETRSVDGENHNWDNSYKIYTVINQGSGAKGVYLGYAQNEKIGAWDNSGNPHNELVLPSNQPMKKLLVDEANGIIIQTPVL